MAKDMTDKGKEGDVTISRETYEQMMSEIALFRENTYKAYKDKCKNLGWNINAKAAEYNKLPAALMDDATTFVAEETEAIDLATYILTRLIDNGLPRDEKLYSMLSPGRKEITPLEQCKLAWCAMYGTIDLYTTVYAMDWSFIRSFAFCDLYDTDPRDRAVLYGLRIQFNMFRERFNEGGDE